MTLETRVICLHHLEDPEKRPHYNKPGFGNCFECTADAKNTQCAGYVPVAVLVHVKKEIIQ